MRKIITALTFTGLLFLAIGCSSDDSSTLPPPPPPEPTTQELLIGKWNIQEEGEVVNGVKKAFEMDACSTKDTYEFTKDLKYINEYHETTVNNDCSTQIDDATWVLKDDQSLLLTFIADVLPLTTITADLKITRLTTTELHLEHIEDGETYYLLLKK
ncbi:lipocalin family protein [Flavobacterium sp. NKUCC04_CG]|uniref:lipocalin family protein n=1 Tax=Flavobacterium sp. NKUCC04_CG TaxID=2842121 RepID=UPI001C5B8D90|nr:lipocalin family protein [Flavobacterium sp. NKUCC04_CG]MBW3519798.1 lipocalin family protein [Flavobacterium sp. NKUCC04_CG]